MRCEGISGPMAGVVDDDVQLTSSEQRHVEQCLRCQAELAQYRKLLRAMHGLRRDQFEVPDGLFDDICEHLGSAGERHAVLAALTGRRVAYLGGIAAATAAAGAGAAIVLATRGRKGRFALAG